MATQLRPFLTDIANAIRSKKGTSDPINAQNFASEIASISTGGGDENPIQTLVTGRDTYGGYYLCYNYEGDNVDFLNGIDFSATTNMNYMFQNCLQLTAIPQLDTSNVTTMYYMFQNCPKLTAIPQLDTSNVTDMDNMFAYCKALTTVPLLNTSKVTDMSYMFQNCIKLTTIPQLDTSNVTNMYSMFNECKALTTVPLLNTSKVTTMYSMFYRCVTLQTIDITKLADSNSYFAAYCYRLTTLIIRTMDTIPTFGSYIFGNCYHFTGQKDSNVNPDGLQDGRIYVPDDKVDALKTATGWSEFADIIVPLSTLVED